MSENTATVKLDYPIPAIGDQPEISELTFGRLKAKHFKKLPQRMMEQAADGEEVNITAAEMVPVIGALAGITEEQADEIDLEDVDKIAAVIMDFFGRYQGTGSGSSGQ